MRLLRRAFLGLSAAILLAVAGAAAQQLSPATTVKIDEIATKALTDTDTPSVSLAIVHGGKIAYEKAYGKARLDPPADATTQMRYSIGSVSKQFLAGSVLLLVQDGKLSLDDRVSRFLPNLTRANEVTVRELLSHTSGYQDYYPQDYLPPFMQKPATPESILERWATKPLDFDPGTRWQYSNTNYVVAGQIVERVTGGPFFAFLAKRVLEPLGMTSPIDLDEHTLGPSDPGGYTRFALGRLRPAPVEARGWLYAAGELAMTAHDLALWDISLMKHTLLTPASLEFDDDSSATAKRHAHQLRYGRGSDGRPRASQAVSWRRSVGLREWEHRLAGSRHGGGRVGQSRRLARAPIHHRPSRGAPVDGDPGPRRGAGIAAGQADLRWTARRQDRSRPSDARC